MKGNHLLKSSPTKIKLDLPEGQMCGSIWTAGQPKWLHHNNLISNSSRSAQKKRKEENERKNKTGVIKDVQDVWIHAMRAAEKKPIV
jgi:hypothetical protein